MAAIEYQMNVGAIHRSHDTHVSLKLLIMWNVQEQLLLNCRKTGLSDNAHGLKV